MNPNDRCIAHLEAGGLLLAPDLRQARLLRRLHDRRQAAAGRRVWPTAQVLPIDAWLAQQWEQAAALRTGLPAAMPPVALRWLWRREAARDAGLLDPAELGARARASWLRLRAHGGDLAQVARWPLTRDQQAFLGWSRAVEGELRARGACDAKDLARLLRADDVLPVQGPSILLAGFRRMTPAQEALFQGLTSAGRQVERLARPAITGSCHRHRAADPQSGRRTMLAWLRAQLARAPDGVHAVIVPDLAATRGALERSLAAALQPGLELPAAAGGDRVFDIAGGDPLAVQPVADAALAALACATGAIDWATASRLLLSPHVGNAGVERAARIAADLGLRSAPGAARLRAPRLAERAAQAGATRFAASVTSALAALEGPRRRGAAAWAEAFGACLGAWDWPGDSTPGSREYQAARRLGEILRELATLAAVAGEMGAAEALAELRRLAAAPFQPESGEPAVLVLDAWEEPGVHLDSLWVEGLTAAAWPRPVTVDPLLPIELQRLLGMPDVTPERCVADARDLIAAWRAGSAALVLSWPQVENDAEVEASPLLPEDAPPLAPPPEAATRERLAFDARRLEYVPESPLPPLPSARAQGGARLLELQALCPFRAFAQLRLGVAPFEEPRPGFDRRLRGIVLHHALEAFWQGLGGRAALAGLEAPARAARIAGSVDAALAAATPAGTTRAAIGLEAEWQRLAVARLVGADLERPPFEVVETERSHTLAIGGLELGLRVDRADRIGVELVVIDYKTGRTRTSAWRGARMDAPQLPLYAVLHPDRPTGIAFAGAGAVQWGYVGVARDGAAIPGLQPAEKFALTEDRGKGFTWPEITAHWRAWLERLAADFAAGRAEVDPKRGAETCRHCHLAALCRVESGLDPGDDEEEGHDD